MKNQLWGGDTHNLIRGQGWPLNLIIGEGWSKNVQVHPPPNNIMKLKKNVMIFIRKMIEKFCPDL